MSSNQADRCPIPPPINTAFFAGILPEISLIRARIERGRGRRLMCSICSPIPAAIAGSESPLSISSDSNIENISSSDI